MNVLQWVNGKTLSTNDELGNFRFQILNFVHPRLLYTLSIYSCVITYESIIPWGLLYRIFQEHFLRRKFMKSTLQTSLIYSTKEEKKIKNQVCITA